jgi:hypothetical protein
LYVEINEAVFISLCSAVAAYFLSRRFTIPAITRYTLLIPLLGFLLFWLWSIADIIIDHFLYFTGKEDGQPMGIGFKVDEYSDDLFLLSIFSTIVTSVLSFFLVLFKKPQNRGV